MSSKDSLWYLGVVGVSSFVVFCRQQSMYINAKHESQYMAIKLFEGLTEKQNALVLATLDGATPIVAAELAGYENPAVVYATLRLPNVISAIRNEISRRIVVDGAPLGLRVLIELAKDAATLPAVRRACARDLMAMAGHVAPKASEAAPGGSKPLHEMTSDELRGTIDRLESELGARATVVYAPNDALPNTKPLNWLD